MSRCPPGEIAGGLGCYFCAGPRDEEIPLCAEHWKMAGEKHRATLAGLYIVGQHATGQCRHGWIAAISAACLRLDALEPPEPEPLPEDRIVVAGVPARQHILIHTPLPEAGVEACTFQLTSPEPKPPPHLCHAEGCKERVPPELLMCRRHWRMVPGPERDAVWASYRPGQCDDKRPSVAWFQAADRAILSVARKEKRSVAVARLEVAIARREARSAEETKP